MVVYFFERPEALASKMLEAGELAGIFSGRFTRRMSFHLPGTILFR